MDRPVHAPLPSFPFPSPNQNGAPLDWTATGDGEEEEVLEGKARLAPPLAQRARGATRGESQPALRAGLRPDWPVGRRAPPPAPPLSSSSSPSPPFAALRPLFFSPSAPLPGGVEAAPAEAAAPSRPLGRPLPALRRRRRHAGADRQRGPHQVRLGDRGGAAAGRAAAALPGHGQYVRGGGGRPEAFPLAPLDPWAFSSPHPDGLDALAGSSRWQAWPWSRGSSHLALW